MQKGFSEEVTCELNPKGCIGIAGQSSLYRDPKVKEFGTIVIEVGRVVQKVVGSWLDKWKAEYREPL